MHRHSDEYDPTPEERSAHVDTPPFDLSSLRPRIAYGRAIVRLMRNIRDRAWLEAEMTDPVLPKSPLYCDTVIALVSGGPIPDPDPQRYPELREIDYSDADAPGYVCWTCRDRAYTFSPRGAYPCHDCQTGRQVRDGVTNYRFDDFKKHYRWSVPKRDRKDGPMVRFGDFSSD